MRANPCASFPNLRILATQSLLLQEQADAGRIGSIVDSMTKEGVLRDPPVVAITRGNDLKYMVLDGADYVLALRNLRIPHILGQVVGPGSSMISRALRVNYPLTALMDRRPLIEKNKALRQWLQERILERSVRCYEEATILFDE